MKEDLIGTCNEQQQLKNDEFMHVWCKRCRNVDCERAEWGTSGWEERMATQAERLLHNPNFADPDDPVFEAVKQQHFADMLNRATQIEIADQKGDWEIPDLLANEATSVNEQNCHRVAKPDTTGEVDFAAQQLAAAKGRELPAPPEPEPPPVAQEPAHFTPEEDEPIPEAPQEETRPQNPVLPVNTPIPAQGIMVDGSAPPPMTTEEMMPTPQTDPWGVPLAGDTVIEVGGTVTLGPPPSEEDDSK